MERAWSGRSVRQAMRRCCWRDVKSLKLDGRSIIAFSHFRGRDG